MTGRPYTSRRRFPGPGPDPITHMATQTDPIPSGVGPAIIAAGGAALGTGYLLAKDYLWGTPTPVPAPTPYTPYKKRRVYDTDPSPNPGTGRPRNINTPRRKYTFKIQLKIQSPPAGAPFDRKVDLPISVQEDGTALVPELVRAVFYHPSAISDDYELWQTASSRLTLYHNTGDPEDHQIDKNAVAWSHFDFMSFAPVAPATYSGQLLMQRNTDEFNLEDHIGNGYLIGQNNLWLRWNGNGNGVLWSNNSYLHLDYRITVVDFSLFNSLHRANQKKIAANPGT